MEDRKELREVRKRMLTQMEQKLHETWSSEEDSLFYYHRSEDRIVLSHALFWVMTQLQSLKGNIRKEKLPTVTTFSPRDRLSKLSSPLGLPKEFFSCFDNIKKRCLTLIFKIARNPLRCCTIAMCCMRLCP